MILMWLVLDAINYKMHTFYTCHWDTILNYKIILDIVGVPHYNMQFKYLGLELMWGMAERWCSAIKNNNNVSMPYSELSTTIMIVMVILNMDNDFGSWDKETREW